MAINALNQGGSPPASSNKNPSTPCERRKMYYLCFGTVSIDCTPAPSDKKPPTLCQRKWDVHCKEWEKKGTPPSEKEKAEFIARCERTAREFETAVLAFKFVD